jgi:hypothetical protein
MCTSEQVLAEVHEDLWKIGGVPVGGPPSWNTYRVVWPKAKTVLDLKPSAFGIQSKQ